MKRFLGLFSIVFLSLMICSAGCGDSGGGDDPDLILPFIQTPPNSCASAPCDALPNAITDSCTAVSDTEYTCNCATAYSWNSTLTQCCEVGPPYFSTGCPGPWGWVWHVSACSKCSLADAHCRDVCCGFYNGTNNCNNIPSSFGGYTVNACSYNTGRYSMQVSHAAGDFTVTCEVM